MKFILQKSLNNIKNNPNRSLNELMNKPNISN